MFFVLRVEEGEGGLRGRVHDLFHPPYVAAQRVKPDGGLAYYEVTAKMYRGIIPWNTVAEVCGKLKTRAVVPDGLVPDAESGVKLYEPKVLPERLLFNSAVSTLQKMQLDPSRVFITLVDENAYVIDLAHQLKDYACSVCVVTNCIGEYELLAKRLLSEYGLSLIVSGRLDRMVMQSTAVISPRSLCVPLTYSGILFTNERRRLMNAAVLTGNGITLPQKYAKLLPADIDAVQFASALYELCGIDELGMLKYDGMRESAD